MLTSALLFVHLLSFAAYLGAGFGQLRLLRRSQAEGLAPAVRDELERLAAAVVTKIELPAIMGSVVTGAVFIAQNPALMKMGWLHGKLACVLGLLVLSHLEMFNARRIVRAREAGDKADEIAERKARHGVLGAIGTALVVALMILVTFVRLGG